MPTSLQGQFQGQGSHLERYACRLSAVEINSSFYRPHQPATYARWAASVPQNFRFSIKLPKAITHERRLRNGEGLLADFLAQAGQLGDKLGCLLVQLPPSLRLDVSVADAFFAMVRSGHGGAVVLEPRHASWFGPEGAALMKRHRIGLVKADPAPCAGAGWSLSSAGAADLASVDSGIAYYRLHGSPRIYYSDYGEAYLLALTERLTDDARQVDEVWCVFDNTAEGFALVNALDVLGRLESAGP